MATRNVTIIVRVAGAANAARDITKATNALHRLGQQSRRTSDTLRIVGNHMRSLGTTVMTWGKRAGLGLTLLAALAVKAGIKFNATMESQTVAFKGFLGSTKAATAYLQDLFTLAANTPFSFQSITQGARQLMAYGMTAKQTMGTLKDLGNALAASGNFSPEIINRATKALGQIQAAGVLHAQDLNQLIQTNVISVPKLAKLMGGLTTKKLRKEMMKGKISSGEFFDALRKMWTHDPIYKGQAQKQMRTFNGQWEKLHDVSQQAIGNITKPLFELLRKNVLPKLSNMVGRINMVWRNPQVPVGSRVWMTEQELKRTLDPMLKGIKKWFRKNKKAMGQAFNDALDYLIPNMEKWGENAAKAAWKGFKKMSTRNQIIVGGAIALRLGVAQAVITGITTTIIGIVLQRLGISAWGKARTGLPGGSGVLRQVGTTGVMNVTARVVNVYGGTTRGGGTTPTRPGKPGGPNSPVVIPGRPAGKPHIKLKVPPKPPSKFSRARGWAGGAARAAGGKVLGGAKTVGGIGLDFAKGSAELAAIFGLGDAVITGNLRGGIDLAGNMLSFGAAGKTLGKYSGKKGWSPFIKDVWAATKSVAGAGRPSVGTYGNWWNTVNSLGGGSGSPSPGVNASPLSNIKTGGSNRGNAGVFATSSPNEIVIHLTNILDGKPIAKSVHRAAVKKKSTR